MTSSDPKSASLPSLNILFSMKTIRKCHSMFIFPTNSWFGKKIILALQQLDGGVLWRNYKFFGPLCFPWILEVVMRMMLLFILNSLLIISPCYLSWIFTFSHFAPQMLLKPWYCFIFVFQEQLLGSLFIPCPRNDQGGFPWDLPSLIRCVWAGPDSQQKQ